MSFAPRARLTSRKSILPLLIPIALGLLLAFSAHAALAVDLVMSFDVGSSDSPAFDQDGSKLTLMMQAVESYWEDIIEAPGTLNVKFFYEDLEGDDTLADQIGLATVGTRPSACQIRVDTTGPSGGRLWYFDPTPTDNSEYAMEQFLAGNLTPEAKADWFKGTPNGLLEVGYVGEAHADAASTVKEGYDLFSVLLHETSHGLGMTQSVASGETKDLLYNFDRDLVWNRSLSAKCVSEDDPYHLKAETALMQTGTAAGVRILPSAPDVFSIQTTCDWRDTTIDLKRKDFYNSHDTADWNVARNWEGNHLPDSADEVYVRHGGDVELSADAAVGELAIDGNSGVLVGSHKLAVTALDVKSSGTLGVELGNLALSAGFHFVDVEGLASLGGILDINLASGFTPTLGTEFEVMTFGSLQGDFTQYEGVDLGGGLVLQPSLTAHSLILEVVSAAVSMAAPVTIPEPSSAVLLAGLVVGSMLLAHRKMGT